MHSLVSTHTWMRLVTHLQSNQRQTSCKGFYTQGKHWEIVTVKGVEKGGEFAVFYESDQKLHEHELNKTVTNWRQTAILETETISNAYPP